MKAGFAADAALSDDDLLSKVLGMTPVVFAEFLFPAELEALVAHATFASSLVPSVVTPPPTAPLDVDVLLPPATKFRESSEPGMSGAWSAPEIRILMGTVDPENLDWDLIRSIHLPHRTATALASRYYYELNKQRQAHLAGLTPSSDEDEGDDAETLYFDPFREWLRTPLTVDIHGAAAVLGSAHSATVRLFTRSHIQAHARTQVLTPIMTPTLNSFLVAMMQCRSGDTSPLESVHDLNHRILLQNQCGAASTDLWSFCIGERFIPVQINTKLHVLFQSGMFSVLRFFSCSTGNQLFMKTQLEALLLKPGECVSR
jgi:hypothetical protein